MISLLLLVVIPAITGWYSNQGKQIPTDMLATLRYVEIAQRWLLRGFVVLWVFFLGSCFASFLNVVAWRLPRGKGILGSSKCPYCDNKLSFSSNMPIVGWLSSGGRCRSCKLPIPPRYLFVELILGSIFMLVVGIELFCGGINLPARPVDPEWGIEKLVLSPRIDLVQIVVYHLILICTLFVFCLVRLERKPIPYPILIFGIVAGLGFQIQWPWVQLSSWGIGGWPNSVGESSFWMTIALGLMAGAIVGAAIGFSYQNRELEKSDLLRESWFSLVLIGLFLGYPFAIAIALTVLLLDSLLIVLGDTQGTLFWTSPAFKIFCIAIVSLLIWRFTSRFEFWPGPQSKWQVCLAGIGVTMLLSFMNSKIIVNQTEGSGNAHNQ